MKSPVFKENIYECKDERHRSKKEDGKRDFIEFYRFPSDDIASLVKGIFHLQIIDGHTDIYRDKQKDTEIHRNIQR